MFGIPPRSHKELGVGDKVGICISKGCVQVATAWSEEGGAPTL